MTFTIHWCLLAALIGFSMVGAITLSLQIIFGYWIKSGQYDKFDKVK